MPDLLDCALLSLDVYTDGTEVVDEEALRRGWRRVAFLRDDVSGFAGAAYEGARRELVVAHRGTELSDPGDWRALSAIGLGRIPEHQARAARHFLDSLRERRTGVVVLTGHSLGGFLAKWLALECGAPAVAFNAPSLRWLLSRPDMAKRFDENRSGQIHAVQIGSDKIQSDQIHSNQIHNVHAAGDPFTRRGGWVRRVLGEPLGRITEVETGSNTGDPVATRFSAPEAMRTHRMHHLISAIRCDGPARRAA